MPSVPSCKIRPRSPILELWCPLGRSVQLQIAPEPHSYLEELRGVQVVEIWGCSDDPGGPGHLEGDETGCDHHDVTDHVPGVHQCLLGGFSTSQRTSAAVEVDAHPDGVGTMGLHAHALSTPWRATGEWAHASTGEDTGHRRGTGLAGAVAHLITRPYFSAMRAFS